MFLGWYDGDKKKPACYKLADAVERYVEKFGAEPEVCLTNPAEATELAAGKETPALPVKAVSYLPRYTFYVGVADEPAAPLAEAA